MPSSVKNAFITGAAGFIGGYAVREFVDEGWHVFALIHKKTSRLLDELTAFGSVTVIRGDLNDFTAIENGLCVELRSRECHLDVIVHCAGRASDVGRREVFRRVNFESVQNLCGLVNRLNVRRFVFVSTTDVYGLRDFSGESENDLPLQANIPNPYPEFKIKAEEWIRVNLPSNKYAIIRPAAVWGVGDPTLTPRIVSFLKSSPWIIHFGKWHGKNRWPLAHVRNVSAGIYAAATIKEAEGLAVNIIDSEVTSMDEFYRKIAAIYLPQKQLRSMTLPMWTGKIMGSVISGISNLLSLDHPFTDPSIYALYSVSCNLDFSNELLLHLLELSGRKIVTRDQGFAELRELGI